MATKEGMLVYCQPRTAEVTEEEYNLCIRQFDSMSNLMKILIEEGKLPEFLGENVE
jgi:hypothetical protein